MRTGLATSPAGPAAASDPLLPALEHLRVRLDALVLPLDVPSAPGARHLRSELLDQLDDYLLPRVRAMDAPLLAVAGGSTGAGKSTLVSSLVGEVVSRAGVLRPTTRAPVLVHHPDDERSFLGSRVLPSFARVREHGRAAVPGGETADRPTVELPRATHLQLVASRALPPGLALLDAPDIDSVVTANRELAAQLMAAADLWLFVTTAARYADAVPWDLLQSARDRGTSVSVVLNRVPPAALPEVRAHLAAMLQRHGLPDAPLFTITERDPAELVDGLLPAPAAEPLRSWLAGLAADATTRRAVARRTLTGALNSLGGRVGALADAADEQAAALQALHEESEATYHRAVEGVGASLTDGSLLRGEVLARWQEFVGTGEFLRGVEAGIGRLRDRVSAAVRGRPAPAERLGEAVQTGVAALVQAEAARAAREVAVRWRGLPAGAALLAGTDLGRTAADLDERLARMVRDWQSGVLDLVRAQGADRRFAARALSFGVNGVAVVLMLVAFSQTAGLSGVEVGVAAGASVLAQRLLEAVFGDQAVRDLATQAHRDLLDRTQALLASERDRFAAVLDAAGADASAGGELRADLAAVASARRHPRGGKPGEAVRR